MSRKQRELDREMRNCKRKETQLKIAQDSLESTQHLFNSAKEVVDLPNPNVLLNQVRYPTIVPFVIAIIMNFAR